MRSGATKKITKTATIPSSSPNDEPIGLRLSVPQIVDALQQYRELQGALDREMPDQIMSIEGKPFRKKGYWRAISLAFGLSVEPVSEERSVVGTLEDGSDNYVYAVTYRAISPNGRSACGDGSCEAAEKEKGRMHASEHNVRSHGHTRAWNRAVSNLVGFGEVSAEEVERPWGSVIERPLLTPVQPTDGPLLVTAVTPKSGLTKTGKPWTSYMVDLSDGRSGSTFDEVLAREAEHLKVAQIPVGEVVFETKGKYRNLMTIRAVGVVEGGPTTCPNKKGVYTVTEVLKNYHGGYGIATKELGAEYIHTTDVTLAKAAFQSKANGEQVEMVFTKGRVVENGVDVPIRSLMELTIVRTPTAAIVEDQQEDHTLELS